MATSSLSGKKGNVTGVTGVTEIKDWKATITGEALDATSFASEGWKEVILGLQSASGSITAIGNAAPPLPTDGSQTVTLALITDGSSTITVAMTAILNSINIESSADGIVTFSADFTSTGTVTVS